MSQPNCTSVDIVGEVITGSGRSSPDVTLQPVFVPEKAVCSVCVRVVVYCVRASGNTTTDVKFSLGMPSLSYALIMYVPDLAGTVALVAGRGTLSKLVVESAKLAPVVSSA